jgi:hypothetical protein
MSIEILEVFLSEIPPRCRHFIKCIHLINIRVHLPASAAADDQALRRQELYAKIVLAVLPNLIRLDINLQWPTPGEETAASLASSLRILFTSLNPSSAATLRRFSFDGVADASIIVPALHSLLHLTWLTLASLPSTSSTAFASALRGLHHLTYLDICRVECFDQKVLHGEWTPPITQLSIQCCENLDAEATHAFVTKLRRTLLKLTITALHFTTLPPHPFDLPHLVDVGLGVTLEPFLFVDSFASSPVRNLFLMVDLVDFDSRRHIDLLPSRGILKTHKDTLKLVSLQMLQQTDIHAEQALWEMRDEWAKAGVELEFNNGS